MLLIASRMRKPGMSRHKVYQFGFDAMVTDVWP
jgi:hypothetical protein